MSYNRFTPTEPPKPKYTLHGLENEVGGFTAHDIRRFQGATVAAMQTELGVERGTLGIFSDGIPIGDGAWLATVEWTSGTHRGHRECVSRKEFITRMAFRV